MRARSVPGAELQRVGAGEALLLNPQRAELVQMEEERKSTPYILTGTGESQQRPSWKRVSTKNTSWPEGKDNRLSIFHLSPLSPETLLLGS